MCPRFLDVAHIQGKMQPLSDRVHAHSKLLTFMEISMSYTCFSGTELLVHTVRGNLMPPSPHSSKQWAHSFRSWLLCPNLPNRIVVEEQKNHPVPDAPTAPGRTPLELHWCWLGKKFVCSLPDFMNLLNSWEKAESTSCWQSWCHHSAFKPQLIHPSECNLFSTSMCWEAQGEGKLQHHLP